MREYSPPLNAALMFMQGDVYRVTSSATSPPRRVRLLGSTASQSTPSTVTFSPTAPGTIAWPSPCRSRIRSIEKRQTARSGPPWCSRSRWRSPSTPSSVMRATGTAVFGTPPFETLIWTTRPLTRSFLFRGHDLVPELAVLLLVPGPDLLLGDAAERRDVGGVHLHPLRFQDLLRLGEVVHALGRLADLRLRLASDVQAALLLVGRQILPDREVHQHER